MSRLLDLLDQGADLHYGGQVISSVELAERSARVAAGLRARGVGAGDRVAVWLPNIPAWLEVFFACARLGAIAVSVNTRFRAHEVADILARSEARVLVVWPDFRGIDFAAILAGVELAALAKLEHIVVYAEGDDAHATAIEGIPITAYASWRALKPLTGCPGGDEHRCVIFTTSGTTRAPKFVCHLQRTVAQHARDVAAALELHAPEASVLQALPLCGVFGFTQAMAALAGGAPMYIQPVFDAAAAAAIVRDHAVTHTHGVDDMVAAMLEASDEARPFPSLRHFGFAAFNPALDDIVARADARGLRLTGLYGMSECHALYALQPAGLDADERRKGGGRPVSAAAQVRVRDPDSGELLGVGQRGELEISGPSLFLEYFADPAATAAALGADGYLRTGDLGYLEADGRFCYVARLGDVLRLGGFLTSPLEIEAVIDAHPDVAASQVVAVALDGRLSAVAFVIPGDGERVDEAGVIDYCALRLAAYKVPRRVFSISAFPTTLSANGTKIQKQRLRELAVQQIEGQATS